LGRGEQFYDGVERKLFEEPQYLLLIGLLTLFQKTCHGFQAPVTRLGILHRHPEQPILQTGVTLGCFHNLRNAGLGFAAFVLGCFQLNAS
jgi:hypothetical protein